jgi:hypothetical protein
MERKVSESMSETSRMVFAVLVLLAALFPLVPKLRLGNTRIWKLRLPVFPLPLVGNTEQMLELGGWYVKKGG